MLYHFLPTPKNCKDRESLFAKTWLRTIFARRLVYNLSISVNEELRLKIEDLAINESKCVAIIKDIFTNISGDINR